MTNNLYRFFSLFIFIYESNKRIRRPEMADLIDPSEIMFTPFEPKVKNRFIMYIEGIPAYLIRAAARPSITFEEIELNHINVKRYVKGKGSWEPLEITLYDPIVPSGAQAVWNGFVYIKNLLLVEMDIQTSIRKMLHLMC